MHRILVSASLVLALVLVPGLRDTGAQTAAPTLRVGLIGLDTSHVVAFTQLLNDPANPDHVAGAKVVAAFRGGSPDIEASATRIDGFTATLKDKWQVEIVPSIEALLERVDVVMITSVDGRVHLAQARPVLAAKKPLFIDKPMAGSYKDAAEIVRLARASGTPLFSASSRRYTEDVQGLVTDPRVGKVLGAMTFGPATLEPHHPDLFWYGVHAVETLYTIMGPGCVKVTRTHTAGADVVVGEWRDGRIGTMRGLRDGKTGYGQVAFGSDAVVITTPESAAAVQKPRAGYYGLLVRMVDFFKTGKAPVSSDETLESLAFMEAADLSKARGGAPVLLSDVH